jgi:hypothetical protein
MMMRRRRLMRMRMITTTIIMMGMKTKNCRKFAVLDYRKHFEPRNAWVKFALFSLSPILVKCCQIFDHSREKAKDEMR